MSFMPPYLIQRVRYTLPFFMFLLTHVYSYSHMYQYIAVTNWNVPRIVVVQLHVMFAAGRYEAAIFASFVSPASKMT